MLSSWYFQRRPFFVITTAIISVAIFSRLIFNKKKEINTISQKKKNRKSQRGKSQPERREKQHSTGHIAQNLQILYGTTTGTSKKLAFDLLNAAKSQNIWKEVTIEDLSTYDQDGLEQETDVVFLCSTYTDGGPPPSAQGFFSWLEDLSHDFRVSRTHFGALRFAVFGLGSSEYRELNHFCTSSENLQMWLTSLGAAPLLPLRKGDDTLDIWKQYKKWKKALFHRLSRKSVGDVQPPTHMLVHDRESQLSSKDNSQLDVEDLINERMLTADQIDSDDDKHKDASLNVLDLEDLGNFVEAHGISPETAKQLQNGERRPMATALQRKALSKEGYKLIGTHSAVKLCRWTKNQLRGRGGCYKHTCYGITSYQCMEMTPSLACANKCVFCWRHHKNPVGKEWRWSTDPPEMIVQQGVQLHQSMINEAKGIQGIKPERWQEAFTVKHCALSLVGEPIMYPQINELLRELHKRSISTFLVTNAQFPELITKLDPVTQLYVSIDAGTKEKLKAIDRPLFKDFWERYLQSLKNLRMKGQRTVYRMTLMKDCNFENTKEIQEYAELIRLGDPDFIEIKSVTYSGNSDASTLRMSNVLFHEEVCVFAEMLAKEVGNSYAIACEHQHSLLVLLAKKDKFFINGTWHTWIDYAKFNTLIQEFYSTGKEFMTSDYLAPTPAWAQWGAVERGFDPVESRFIRNKTGQDIEMQYKSSSSGCG